MYNLLTNKQKAYLNGRLKASNVKNTFGKYDLYDLYIPKFILCTSDEKNLPNVGTQDVKILN